MKLFFADCTISPLFHPESPILTIIRKTILENNLAAEVSNPDKADAVIIQENNEYKDYRYSNTLLKDKFISSYLTKIFTISDDDSATGLFRGLYASIPKKRFDQHLHRSVPYIHYSNKFVFTDKDVKEPFYLAGWYGNTQSNAIRKRLVKELVENASFNIKTTGSWYDHSEKEQRDYVELIKSAKFSLCPAGWAPPSPRIYESMALGRCPVIISDEFVPPTGPNWDAFSLRYPEKSISEIENFLLQYENLHVQLGNIARENWNNFFAGDLLNKYYVTTLISLIHSTPRYSKEQEIKRWQSFFTTWKNNWSIPQRLVNRYRLLIK